jgi:hypothetical protein
MTLDVHRVSVPAADLARALGNALIFVGAEGTVPQAVINVRQDRVSVTGTDGYAAGTVYVDAVKPQRIPVEGIAMLVTRPALADLCAAAVAAAGVVRLVVSTPATLTIQANDGDNLITVAWAKDPPAVRMFAALADLMRRAQTDGVVPGVVHVDTSMVARFRAVRADKPNRRAELRATGSRRPILVTIGPTFRGIMMPASRQQMDGEAE